MRYKVGTRGSALSIAQTNWVIDELKKVSPANEFEIVKITTKGDTDARPLFTINQKGIFEREIDNAVIEKKVDFAVHSLKDVPSIIPNDLVLACIPKREAANDIFISREGHTLQTIKDGSIVGTSSLRRAVQLTRMRPNLVVKPIRGNVETRIRKIFQKEFDGVILAEAGISRLGLDVKFERLSTKDFLPSPGQGAIAIITRRENKSLIALLKKIEDPDSRYAIEAERMVSISVDSGCRFPVGALAEKKENKINLNVIAYSNDGKQLIDVKLTGDLVQSANLGEQAALMLKKQGIEILAKNWREQVEDWNKT